MPLHFPYKFDEVEVGVDLSNFFVNKNDELIVWWYCGLKKGKKLKTQPRVLVAFRPIADGVITDEIKYESFPLSCIGCLRIGSVWKRGKCKSIANFEERSFSFTIDDSSWEHTSFFKTYNILNEKPPFPQTLYPLKFKTDKNILLKLYTQNKKELLLPSLEYFSRLYGSSGECKRILATYSAEECYKRFYMPLGRRPEPGVWELIKKGRLERGDSVFLAHYRYDAYTKRSAGKIYAQIETQYDPQKDEPVFIEVDPWFTGDTSLTVRGISFNDDNSFLGLQIIGYTIPLGPPIRMLKTKSEGGTVVDEFIEPGHYVQVEIITPPECVELTDDDEPNHGGSIAKIDSFKIKINNPGRNISERIEPSNSSEVKTSFVDKDKSDVFSPGEQQGKGSKVGLALIKQPVVIESNGILNDLWMVLSNLSDEYKDIITSVEWFTHEDEFNKNGIPKLIRLDPFDEKEVVENDVINWLYIDGKTRKRIRGVLVIKVVSSSGIIYFVEIERKLILSSGSDNPPVYNEEQLTGCIFTLDDNEKIESWLRILLSEIRYKKGMFKKVINQCPGSAHFYKHTYPKTPSTPGESFVKNAFSKVGVTFPPREKQTEESVSRTS